MSGKGKSKHEGARPTRMPANADDKAGKSPPMATDEDDIEDGDIATPKRDRDDEQQGL